MVANIAVLDGELAGVFYQDALIWAVMLIDQLKRLIGSGDQQLGRLTQGVAVGGNPAPWLLGPFTADDEALAAAYLKSGAIGVGELGGTTDEAPPIDEAPPASGDDEPPW